MTLKIALHKGFEYEPDGIFDKKDIAFFTKGDAGYDALVQEMTDISKIISAEHEEPIVQQQLAAVIDWLQNDQKIVAAQRGVPAWVREGYKGKPAKFGQAPPASQEVKVIKLSQQRQHELADFKEKLWSDNPENAAQKINEQIADGNLDYKDVLWLLNDNQLGDSQTWEWAAAVILRLTPKEFVLELLEHFSEGYFGPQVRTPMLMSVMTEVDAQRAAHLLANTKFLQWALRLEEQYFGMSLNNSRALIRALYEERAMTPQELAGLLIYLVRLHQEKVEGHSLYTIKEAAANQLTLLKSILDEMQPQDAAVIMDAFRREFGQGIDLKGITSSSPISSDDEVGGIDMNAIDLDKQGGGVDIQFDPAQLQELIESGIDGFAPVIINITPLPSVLPLLGLEPRKEEEAAKELSRLN